MATEIEDVKRRLANARKRVAYWSGRPSFTAKSFDPKRMSPMRPPMKYEEAMDDLVSLASELERLTGKPVKATDYREEFAVKFNGPIIRAIKKAQGATNG